MKVMNSFDPSDTALIVCLFLLIVVFGGDPDLMDAIIHWIMS